MRRNIMALAVTALLALGACGGDSTESASDTGDTAASQSSTDNAINDAESCEELIDAAQPIFVDLFQGLVDDTQELSVEDLATLSTDVEGSGLIKDFTDAIERDGAVLEERANKLGCSEEDAQSALCQAVDQIDAKGSTLAETMISGMKAECV